MESLIKVCFSGKYCVKDCSVLVEQWIDCVIEYNKEATDALYFYHKLLLGESIKFQSSLTEVNFQKNNHSNAVTYLFLILQPQPWFNSKNSIMLINASYYGEPICHLTIFLGDTPLYAARKGLVFVVIRSKNRYRLCPFWSGNSGVEGTAGAINTFVVSIPNESKGKSNMQI